MKHFRIYGVSALLGATLAMGVASCSSSDPATEVTTPVAPKVEVNNTVSGVITSMSGDPIQGAKISMGTNNATTGADGTYSFEKVAAGTYDLAVEATGKVSTTGSVTIAATDNGNHVVNFTLSNEGTKLEVKTDGSQEGSAETETLKGNDAAKIEVEVEAPAQAVEVAAGEAQPEIIITPTYSAAGETQASARTRATDDLFLIGSDISCSKKDAKLVKHLSLTYNVDAEMLKAVKAKKYVNGKWTDATVKETGTNSITIDVDQFASYGLFCSATLSSGTPATENISFTKSLWDNTAGSSEITADKAEYTYKLGTDVTVQKDKVLAYLVEMLVRATGAGLKTVTGSYPLNVKLPVGTALSISGVQAVTTHTASLGSKKVSAKQYGNVTLTTKTWAVNRDHTGGGSK